MQIDCWSIAVMLMICGNIYVMEEEEEILEYLKDFCFFMEIFMNTFNKF